MDFENVHEIGLNVIGSKTVHLTLLLGPRQTKLDAALVEKLLEHAATVELVRLASAGRNAVDFTLAYYLGRAVAADPTGHFHIISKDAGYDPLVEHLRSKHIRARRQEDCAALTFTAAPKTPAAIAAPKPESQPKPTAPPPPAETAAAREKRVLEHLRKPTTKRPGTQKKLRSYLIAHLGNKITETEADRLIQDLGQAGHLFIGEKGKVTYLAPA